MCEYELGVKCGEQGCYQWRWSKEDRRVWSEGGFGMTFVFLGVFRGQEQFSIVECLLYVFGWVQGVLDERVKVVFGRQKFRIFVVIYVKLREIGREVLFF